jgi:hypothetical protein
MGLMLNSETAPSNKIIRFKIPSSRERVIQQLIEGWVVSGEFRTGLWDATTKVRTYKIISHPSFTGKFIPNDKVSSMVAQERRIWQSFHAETLQEGESYRDYFRVLTPRKKRP